MSNQEVRDVLLKAAKLVSEGWCQGSYALFNKGAPTYCLVGAIGQAGVPYGKETHDRALSLLRDRVGDCTAWNDTPGRLQIEVEDALRETALSLGDAE